LHLLFEFAKGSNDPQMLKMVVKIIFSTIFLCRSAFSPYLCYR